MAISTPDVITRYFAAQAARDFDTLVTLFADDAVVIDDGQTSRGTIEIRAWRENVASVYEYTHRAGRSAARRCGGARR